MAVVFFEMMFFIMMMGWMISSCLTQKDKTDEIKKSRSQIDKLKKEEKMRRRK